LLHLLAARGRLSAAELAAALEVSVRTVYRDIESLSSAGFPIYAEHGPRGGYELLADFRSPFVVLTPAEIGLLVRLGPPPAAGDLGLGSDVEGAYDKLAVALSRASASQHRQLVLVDAPRWFAAVATPSVLEPLARAITGALQVRVTRGGRTSTLDPLGLVNKAGRWYLVGRGGDQVRAYRVDRIDTAEPAGERFEPPAGFELEAFWSAWVRDFEASRPTVEVTVEVPAPAVAELPKALGDHVAVALERAAPDPCGNRVVRIPFRSVEAAVHHLTGAGHLARVVAPEQVRRAVLERARGIAGGATAT
jgi:predicted DNA-binding transcriptional regulator YafY